MVAIRWFAMGVLSLAVLQDAVEIKTTQTPAIFKSTTNLVPVPVVVRDGQGRTVGNLGADDFRLFDQGKPQLISRFAVEQMLARETLQARAGNSGAEVVDGTVGSALPTRFLAYLADDENMVPADFVLGRTAALRHIQTLGPTERAAVYSTSGRVSLPFTDDHELLRKALQDINSLNRPQTWTDRTLRCKPMTFYRADLIVAGDPATIIDCAGRPVTADPTAAGAQIARLNEVMVDAEMVLAVSERDLRAFFNALDRLIDKMAELPGERAIVLLSPGVYVPGRFRQVESEIIAHAIRARVVISGVDVRGVPISYKNGGDDPTIDSTRYALGETGERIGFMTDLAMGTGGTFLRGNNDLDLQLRRAASIPEYVYVLSFAPADLKLDGKLHALKVALKNPRGFTLQARSQYYAASYATDPAERVRQQIEEAFFSSQELKDVPVQLRTQFFKDGDDATLTVTAKVDATKLPFRKEGGRNRDELTLVVGLFDQNGNYVSAYRKVIDLRLKDETMAEWLKAGIETATDFSVKPGKYLVRLVVRDAGSQLMAEQSTGVAIPW